jgi:hypothetical protein
MFGQMLSASLPVLGYEDFDRSSTVAGLFFAAFGAGSLVGVVLALKLVPRFDPIRLGAVSIVALTVPIPCWVCRYRPGPWSPCCSHPRSSGSS